jgi:hypothetical protein
MLQLLQTTGRDHHSHLLLRLVPESLVAKDVSAMALHWAVGWRGAQGFQPKGATLKSSQLGKEGTCVVDSLVAVVLLCFGDVVTADR